MLDYKINKDVVIAVTVIVIIDHPLIPEIDTIDHLEEVIEIDLHQDILQDHVLLLQEEINK